MPGGVPFEKLVAAMPLPGQAGAPPKVYGRLEPSTVGPMAAAIVFRGIRWEVDVATATPVRGENKRLLKTFLKTQGHCHFCGDEIDFEKRGWKADLTGRWEEDHVIQRAKKGPRDQDNLLPACTRCNRLRSSKSGAALRRVLFWGLIARDEAYEKPGSDIGKALRELRIGRLVDNYLRRIPASRRPTESQLEELTNNYRSFETRALKRYRFELKRRQSERREVVRHLKPGEKKPKRVSVGWTKVLQETLKDPQTPKKERLAEETLRE